MLAAAPRVKPAVARDAQRMRSTACDVRDLLAFRHHHERRHGHAPTAAEPQLPVVARPPRVHLWSELRKQPASQRSAETLAKHSAARAPAGAWRCDAPAATQACDPNANGAACARTCNRQHTPAAQHTIDVRACALVRGAIAQRVGVAGRGRSCGGEYQPLRRERQAVCGSCTHRLDEHAHRAEVLNLARVFLRVHRPPAEPAPDQIRARSRRDSPRQSARARGCPSKATKIQSRLSL